LPNLTNYGLPPVGKTKIAPLRIIRTLVGLAIVVQAVFWAQPDAMTMGVKIGAGLLLVDVTLFRALKNGGK